MGRDNKRKGRLDKAGSATAQFIGFSAFAPSSSQLSESTSNISGASPTNDAKDETIMFSQFDVNKNTVVRSDSIPGSEAFFWSPVYTGSDERLQLLFPRIASKRDAITKVKALQELESYLHEGEKEEDASMIEKKTKKRNQVEAIQHFAFLYYSRLHYDTSSAVRAQSLRVWLQALNRAPRATVALLTSTQPELLGMIYATCQADPAMEVRTVPLFTQLEQHHDPQHSWPWQQGLIERYAPRILSYGKSLAMHQDLFARKNNDVAAPTEQQKDLMEERYDLIVGACLDGLTMYTRQYKLVEPSSVSNGASDTSLVATTKFWWKTLSSNKVSLRRKTYQLLASVSTSQQPLHKVLLPESLRQMLVQALSTETEISNLPSLLELILALGASLPAKSTTSHCPTSTAAGSLTVASLMAAVSKPLLKLISRALYGAPVQFWGPTLLPLYSIVTKADPMDGPRQGQLFLQSIQHAVDKALGETDAWQLRAALAECAAFGLLRRQLHLDANSSTMNNEEIVNMSQNMAKLWIQTLEAFLTLSSDRISRGGVAAGGPAAQAQDLCVGLLGKHLVQFQMAKPDTLFARIQAWFWNEEMKLTPHEPARLLQLLSKLKENTATAAPSSMPIGSQYSEQSLNQNSSDSSLSLVELVVGCFYITVSKYQQSSEQLPSVDDYALMMIILDYCGVRVIYSDMEILQRFILNDVLKWVILHMAQSSSCTAKQSSSQPTQDFCILSRCLLALDAAKRDSVWQAVLREILAVKYDLGFLVAGFRVLGKPQGFTWMSCPTLDQFAIQVGADSSHSVTESKNLLKEENGYSTSDEIRISKRYANEVQFLRLCLGLDGTTDSAGLVVSRQVLAQWIEKASRARPSYVVLEQCALLEALMNLIFANPTELELEETESLLVECWRRGGHLYDTLAVPVWQRDSSLKSKVIGRAGSYLQIQLSYFASEPTQATAPAVAVWAEQAARLLALTHEGAFGDDSSYDVTGLRNMERWVIHPSVMYKCCMALFPALKNWQERLLLVQQSLENPSQLANVLVAISEASADVLSAARARQRRDRCWLFLLAIGGNQIDKSLLNGSVRSVVADLSTYLSKRTVSIDDLYIYKAVAVASQVLGLLFLPIAPKGATSLNPADIITGSQLWYRTDVDDSQTFELVKVVKVHVDAEAGYFFTIELRRDSELLERQTIAERLQLEPVNTVQAGVDENNVLEAEGQLRAATRLIVMEGLIRPFFMQLNRDTLGLGEFLHVVANHIGVGKERGLGSVHYELFHHMVGLVDSSCDDLLKKEWQSAARVLWTLSLSLGYGCNTPSSKWTIRQYLVDTEKLLSVLLDVYDGLESFEICPELDQATLSWLTVALCDDVDEKAEKRNSLLLKSLTILFGIASNILANSNRAVFSSSQMIACRAVSSAVDWIRRLPQTMQSIDELINDELVNAQSDAMFSLIGSFATGWINRDESDEEFPEWELFSTFPGLIRSAKRNRRVWSSLARACRAENANYLSSALFDTSKQYVAFSLLDALACQARALQSADGDVNLSTSSMVNLAKWLQGLDTEEAGEVEEDVYIVAEWVPLQMMTEIESWADRDFEILEEHTTLGEFLTWLCLLRFADVATSKGFRNRPAFASYLTRCGAVGFILNLALLHDEAINDRKQKTAFSSLTIDDLLGSENFHCSSVSTLELISKLAPLVLFRTIEVLPSLARRWWETDIPKVYVNPVQSFVEKRVAPEILKRELACIKDDVDVFGSMNVTASLVTREVTATYVQDDFKLSVLISLPSSFPLRSAEVDCSKTLGVPQNRWKRWSLQIMLMLNSQGGTLQDALLLWKDNVDKEFEGVEPCPVCYSVLHVKSHKLPALECVTCHNRFHVNCLTEWFRSSGKSNCVLCQQPWQGTRV